MLTSFLVSKPSDDFLVHASLLVDQRGKTWCLIEAQPTCRGQPFGPENTYREDEGRELRSWTLKKSRLSWFDFGVITLRQLSTGLWPWTGVSTSQTAGKSAIFVLCCRFAQGLQGHHFPTGRVAGRGTGSHGGRKPRVAPVAPPLGPRQVERQRAGRQAEELRRLKMEKERVERAPLGNRFKTSWFLDIFGNYIVEVKEWDVEWFWDVGMHIGLPCFTDMQILYIIYTLWCT